MYCQALFLNSILDGAVMFSMNTYTEYRVKTVTVQNSSLQGFRLYDIQQLRQREDF